MNAAYVCLLTGLALVATHAAAHPPGVAGSHPPPVPQPVAPSSLPDETDRYAPYLPHIIEDHRNRYVDGDRRAEGCTARRTTEEASMDDAEKQLIDWCALPPFEPRYAPQIPAEWWWRRGHWREWRPW